MPRSAKSALIEARRHIGAVEKAQGTKDIIKQYQKAKNILAEVDTQKEDAPSLKDMIGTFIELADVLETRDQPRRTGRKIVSSLSKSTATTATVANNSTATSPTTSIGNVVSPASFTPQLQPLSTTQATVSISAPIGSPKTSLLFSKKADRGTSVRHLPAPGEQLKTTRQLAYCLALLQNSVDETCLNPDTLKWRRNTLNNPDEMIRMETVTRQVVTKFIEDRVKDATVVEEVVQLAQVIHEEMVRSLLASFVDTVSKSELLHLYAMEGLARVIQCATPGSINSNDLVTILQVLYTRLQTIHTPSTSHLCRLLLAVSRVLDAMVVAQVDDVNRIALHEPLTALLHDFESNQDPFTAFQAEYATQALLNVSDNDNIWQAGFRQGWLVLKGAAGFAKMPDPKEIKDALEGLEKLYEAGKGAVRMLNNTWVAIRTSEKPAFTTKEGLKFKRIWYPTLRNAEEYIQTGDLVGFKELVTNAPCRHQLKFQLGICQLLGRFAVDAQWDLESQQSTLAFLGALCQTDDFWVRQKGIEQGIFNMISTLADNHDIQAALKTHYAPDLLIRRISGDELDLETCFINLAIVESPAQREKEKQNLKEQAAVFHRIPRSKAVEGSNIQSSIPFEQLFDKRKLRDGKENVPKRILVQGRAGIGKTTLCKKLVHAHQNGLWKDLFDTVLWLPLRQLRQSTSRTLESLLRENFFDTQQLDREQKELARTLTVRAEEGKVLFILDGLDEIATYAQGEGSTSKALLETLFRQHYVVITSRPSGLNRLLLLQIDLELETIGFSQQNVNEFVVKVLEPKSARKVQDFIQRTPLIQGLVNIPVQLDVICFCWKSLPTDGLQVTMAKLYQLMVRKLWCKDALRLEKTRAGSALTEEKINKLTPKSINQMMATELRHLGYLAFKGLKNDHQIEFDEAALLDAFEDLIDDGQTDDTSPFPSQVLDWVKHTSFLNTAVIDHNKRNSHQSWYFLHLTFQEYFAATWIASKLMRTGKDDHNLSAGSTCKAPTVQFVQEHKYDPKFEIFWWMVAGLLEGEALEEFFHLLQNESRDLIGGRHQQLLASCLDEARGRLDDAVVTKLDEELLAWLHFEILTCRACWVVGPHFLKPFYSTPWIQCPPGSLALYRL
ncbi:hypothetical protein BGZ96_005012 [Linnemannia gamsii]|uniref:NACHT domain-containing protein n=1 Tax=Linnemannia gamsii TaxID=64522 RepID=A0ABQ7K6D3_9FUNG|nr:hypothetical protein BGZ96_005012 [Linnemannia gamsii]